MTWLGGLKVSVQLGFNGSPPELLIYPYKFIFAKTNMARVLHNYTRNQKKIHIWKRLKRTADMWSLKTAIL